MSIRLVPLADGEIYRDFEADVLERLRSHKATMHGCPIERVECKLDGSIAVWFSGPRDGAFWRGALRLDYPLLVQKKWLADVVAVSETVLQLLSKIGVKSSAPLIQRAN